MFQSMLNHCHRSLQNTARRQPEDSQTLAMQFGHMNVASRAAKNFRGTVQGRTARWCYGKPAGLLTGGMSVWPAMAGSLGGPTRTRRLPRPSAEANASRGGGPLAACMQPLPGRGVADTLSRPAGGRPACAGGRPHVQEARKAIWRTPHHADAEAHCACASSSMHAHGRGGTARPEQGGSYRLATGHIHNTSLFASRAARSARLTPHAYGKGGQTGQW